PRGHAAVHESGAVAGLAVRLPYLRIERPKLAAVRRVEGDHTIERRREEQRVVDREWRRLELPPARRLLTLARRDRLLLGIPGERDRELRHVRAIDVAERRVFQAPGVVAVRGPVYGLLRERGGRSEREERDNPILDSHAGTARWKDL